MFKSLKFDVQFAQPRQGHTGHLKGDHKFATGMTIIHGPNEAGKSLRAEFLRFALWGRKALRSKVSAYSKLNVEIEFQLKGVDYYLKRSKSNALLKQAGQDFATGTSPVNDAIETLFGYDMKVFDLANAVLQGEVEALGRMKPAERKSLVDSLIGLNVIDDTIKELSDERRLDKQTLATMRDTLVEPEEPTMIQELSDDEMQSFPRLKRDVLRARAIENELRGLKVTVPVKPKEPDQETIDLSLHHALMVQMKKAAATAASYLASQEQGKDTGYTPEKLGVMYTEALTHEACEDVECPNCSTVFNPSGVDKPDLSSQQVSRLRAQQAAYQKWLEAKSVSDKAQKDYDDLPFDKVKVKQAMSSMVIYADALKVYEAQVKASQNTQTRIEKLEQELLQLEKYSGDFENYENLYNSSLTAQHLMVQYTKYKATYDLQKAKYDELESKISDYDAAIIGLRNLKVKIKSYLVPSLNKVASAYLVQMTDGARSSIVISEEFDIRVDGQPLDALSGSAKAVANLSIRLALGQTLTNSVFSVLLADEIDASMDTERAEYTAKCLRNLKGNIKQIIIISHKKLDADNYVELT